MCAPTVVHRSPRVHTNRYAQAHEECDIALKLNVGNVKARIRRARALVVLALFGDAIQDYDAVSSMAPLIADNPRPVGVLTLGVAGAA